MIFKIISIKDIVIYKLIMISFLFTLKSSHSIVQYTAHGGPVKGLAVTLSIGLITTLFSAYFISRHLTSIIVFRNREKKLLI